MTYGEAGTSRSAIGSSLVKRQIQKARSAPNFSTSKEFDVFQKNSFLSDSVLVFI